MRIRLLRKYIGQKETDDIFMTTSEFDLFKKLFNIPDSFKVYKSKPDINNPNINRYYKDFLYNTGLSTFDWKIAIKTKVSMDGFLKPSNMLKSVFSTFNNRSQSFTPGLGAKLLSTLDAVGYVSNKLAEGNNTAAYIGAILKAGGNEDSYLNYRVTGETLTTGHAIYDGYMTGLKVYEGSEFNNGITFTFEFDYTQYSNIESAAWNFYSDMLFLYSLTSPLDEKYIKNFKLDESKAIIDDIDNLTSIRNLINAYLVSNYDYYSYNEDEFITWFKQEYKNFLFINEDKKLENNDDNTEINICYNTITVINIKNIISNVNITLKDVNRYVNYNSYYSNELSETKNEIQDIKLDINKIAYTVNKNDLFTINENSNPITIINSRLYTEVSIFIYEQNNSFYISAYAIDKDNVNVNKLNINYKDKEYDKIDVTTYYKKQGGKEKREFKYGTKETLIFTSKKESDEENEQYINLEHVDKLPYYLNIYSEDLCVNTHKILDTFISNNGYNNIYTYKRLESHIFKNIYIAAMLYYFVGEASTNISITNIQYYNHIISNGLFKNNYCIVSSGSYFKSNSGINENTKTKTKDIINNYNTINGKFVNLCTSNRRIINDNDKIKIFEDSNNTTNIKNTITTQKDQVFLYLDSLMTSPLVKEKYKDKYIKIDKSVTNSELDAIELIDIILKDVSLKEVIKEDESIVNLQIITTLIKHFNKVSSVLIPPLVDVEMHFDSYDESQYNINKDLVVMTNYFKQKGKSIKLMDYFVNSLSVNLSSSMLFYSYNNMNITFPASIKYDLKLIPAKNDPFEKIAIDTFNISKDNIPSFKFNVTEPDEFRQMVDTSDINYNTNIKYEAITPFVKPDTYTSKTYGISINCYTYKDDNLSKLFYSGISRYDDILNKSKNINEYKSLLGVNDNYEHTGLTFLSLSSEILTTTYLENSYGYNSKSFVNFKNSYNGKAFFNSNYKEEYAKFLLGYIFAFNQDNIDFSTNVFKKLNITQLSQTLRPFGVTKSTYASNHFYGIAIDMQPNVLSTLFSNGKLFIRYNKDKTTSLLFKLQTETNNNKSNEVFKNMLETCYKEMFNKDIKINLTTSDKEKNNLFLKSYDKSTKAIQTDKGTNTTNTTFFDLTDYLNQIGFKNIKNISIEGKISSYTSIEAHHYEIKDNSSYLDDKKGTLFYKGLINCYGYKILTLLKYIVLEKDNKKSAYLYGFGLTDNGAGYNYINDYAKSYYFKNDKIYTIDQNKANTFKSNV